MRLLLDTHVLLWWLQDPALLSPNARAAIKDGENAVYISAAVIWELVIKKSLGKLSMPNDLESVLNANYFLSLPIIASHTLAIESLPLHHRDPFDRMLVAQASYENMSIVTRDPHILKYEVKSIIA